jgi:calmodulin
MSVQDVPEAADPDAIVILNQRGTPDLSHVSQSKLRQYKLAFKQFDKDGSGCIDVLELRQLFALINIFPDDDELEELVCEFDTNSNGQLEFAEFVSMLETKEGNDAQSRATLIKAFQAMDTDNSGFIGADELELYMARVKSPGFTSDHAAEMMVAADKNGDGEIDYEEFAQFLMSNGVAPPSNTLNSLGQALGQFTEGSQ